VEMVTGKRKSQVLD